MPGDYRRYTGIWQTIGKPFGAPGSVAVDTAARQYAQNDDHALLIVEREADAPVANAQAPLERAQLANVGRERIPNEAIERINDPSANGGSSRRRSRRAGGVTAYDHGSVKPGRDHA
jgi:hypothetical protein